MGVQTAQPTRLGNEKMEITRAMWTAQPAGKKRRRKDGSRWIWCETPGKPGGRWVQVYWKR